MNWPLNDFLPDESAPETVIVVPGTVLAAGYMLITEADIRHLLQPRRAFSHKGSYGHALIIAGAAQTMGAALLTSKGCLYGGAGLTTASVPETGLNALNTSLPEVMYIKRKSLLKDDSLTKYNAVAIGPGLGTGAKAERLLEQLFNLKREFIADADALNILSVRPDLLSRIEKHTILTPHVKEFDKLFGSHANWWERLQSAITRAIELGIVIVLKNQYTFIVSHRGEVFINPTGNPAMAQGGMGDVLTGIVAAFVAQGYAAKDAAILGCYFHGRAGDDLARDGFIVTASQVAVQVPRTIKEFIG